MKFLKKNYGIFYYFLFLVAVLFAYFYFQPSWSAVDDRQHLMDVHRIWNSPNVGEALSGYIVSDFWSQKMRPVHCLYSFFAYRFFSDNPLMLYVSIFLILMLLLPLWGLIFHKLFCGEQKISQSTLFVFPLSFFIFTPFWNNFMYISIQEKFVFVFSTLAIYFLIKTYEEEKRLYFAYSFIAAVLCLLSKPTGIYLVGVFFIHGIFSLIFFKKGRHISRAYSILSLLIVVIYYFFIKASVILSSGGYSFKYVRQFNVMSAVQNIAQSPFIIQFLLLAAIVALWFFTILAKRGVINPRAILVPIGFMSYIGMLIPWRISNYLLAPVAPFAAGMFFPVYLFCVERLKETRFQFVPITVVMVSSFIILPQIIVPRISKVADVKKVGAAIVNLRTDSPDSRFYIPSPCFESQYALTMATEADIDYLSNGALHDDMLSSGKNYLIYRDECSAIELKDVVSIDTVYQNNTWEVSKVVASPGTAAKLNIRFPKTIFQKIITGTANNDS